MLFTYSWLKEHLDLDLDPQALGELLTMSGLELEAVRDLSEGLEKVQTGLLMEVGKHPDADRLTLCKVSVGEDEPLTIVCGATNHKVGDKVAAARVGAKLPNGLKIKKGKIRGVVSEGMLCSLTELGMEESSEGILILPEETPVGRPVADVLKRNDWLFEVDITPNRGDCLGVRGIARDLGAVTNSPLKTISYALDEDHGVAERHPVDVTIEDGEGCPRYSGRVIEGVKVGPSPEWLQNRLLSVGLRPINNVVDVTNYVLMDLGQPLHAFDLKKLQSPVVIRKAREGETLVTLDEVERKLTPEMCLITDGTGPVALAGIMGGENSGTEEDATDIFLESAYFEPVGIARTGRKLGILTDSRFRFERGVDPMGIEQALDWAAHLIIELAGGRAGPRVLADAGTWTPQAPIWFRFKRANRLGGIDLSPGEMSGMLSRLGCVEVGEAVKKDAVFQPPTHRHDLTREEDLLEEIVRLYGYDNVPVTMPEGPVAPPRPDPMAEMIARAKRTLIGRGYLEAVNYAFVSPALQERFDPEREPLALLNPISEDQAVMRTTLAGGLVETARRNFSRGATSLRLFETGRVFLQDDKGGRREPERIGALIAGPLGERSWSRENRPVDFYDMKGDLEGVLDGLGVVKPLFEAGGPDFLHPGRKAQIFFKPGRKDDPLLLGWMGELHPRHRDALDIDAPLFLFELRGGCLAEAEGGVREAASMSRFQAVERDLAFLVPAAFQARTFEEEVKRADREGLVRRVSVVDLYTGQGVPEGMKSLAFSLVIQADDRTLNDAEVEALSQAVVDRMTEKHGAALRGG